jgi:hypothetical protein
MGEEGMKIPRALHAGVRVLRSDGTTAIYPPGEVGWSADTRMRRFQLVRHEDETGISGTGIVAEGVVFTDGTTVLRWTCELTSTCIYESLSDVILIHGHDGKTVIGWVDE